MNDRYAGQFDNVAPGGMLLDPNGTPFYVGYGNVVSGLVLSRTSFFTPPVPEDASVSAGAVLAALLLARRRVR